jgi:hypothetical protein
MMTKNVKFLDWMDNSTMDDEQIRGDELPGDELARLAYETIEGQMGSNEAAAMRIRCQRVIDLYAEGAIIEPRDYFHAAVVLLYGEKSAHYELSRNFSRRAAKEGESRAWTVSAMAWDRWLLAVGKPQRFGTQIIRKDGRWSLGNVDPQISDIDRAFYGVPPLHVQQQRAVQLQRQEDADE